MSVSSSPIVFTGRIDAEESVIWLDALRAALPDAEIVTPEMVGDAQAVELAIVANPDPAVLKPYVNLKWVHSVWAGVERLLAELPADLPIVRLVDPELSRIMGEAVLAWTLCLQRDMPAYARQQSAGVWAQRPYRAPSSLTVGVLGQGQMGLSAAARLRDAGFHVIGWGRTSREAETKILSGSDGLDECLRRADIVVCLLPLTPDTRRLLDRRRFARMRAGAALINFGRGAIVDTEALIEALDAHLSHAVLDVFVTEPLPEASPLWTHDKVTVLPHISAPTNPHTAAAIVAGNIRRWRATGDMPTPIDRSRGY